MKRLLGIILVLFLVMACAGAALLLAMSLFAFRATPGAARPTPVLPVAPGLELSATPTLAAPALGSPDEGGQAGSGAPGEVGSTGFNGAFNGTLTADNGSAAPATLVLSESGGAVSGRLVIGEGLSIDAGNCGVVAVPAGEQDAGGAVDPASPGRLATTVRVPAQGLTVVATMGAELSADGRSIAARVDIDLPFFCGRDAGISGTFNK